MKTSDSASRDLHADNRPRLARNDRPQKCTGTTKVLTARASLEVVKDVSLKSLVGGSGGLFVESNCRSTTNEAFEPSVVPISPAARSATAGGALDMDAAFSSIGSE